MGDSRQKAMDVNRSLRSIKTELETLLEKGAISDDDFNSIHDLLPQEWSLRGGPSTAPKQRQAQPAQTTLQPPQQGPPLPIRNNSHQSTASAASSAVPTPSPSESSRHHNEDPDNNADSDGRTAAGYATAKYTYDAPSDGDLAFDRGDAVAVYSKVNDDWWLGRNVRSGQVGIFPRQYVKPEAALAELERANRLPGPNGAPPPPIPPPANSSRGSSTAPPSYYDQYGNPPQQQQQYGGGDAKYGKPYGQQQQQPYGQQQPFYGGPSDQPPPQQQQQQQQQPQNNGQVKNAGKKIGGKLGNAFVTGVGFAAGAELVGAIL